MASIHQLIHSLTTGERRNFSQFASKNARRGDTQYLQLYKAIVSQTIYNEPLLKKRFGGRLFPQLKQQLQRKIHECLCVNNRNAGNTSDVNDEVVLAGILAGKGFAKEAVTLLNKVIAAAQANHQTHVELVAWKEKNNILSTSGNMEIEAELKAFRQRYGVLQSFLENELLYEGILLEVSILKEEWEGVRSASQHNSVVKFIQCDELKNEKHTMSFFSRMIFHYANGVAYYLLGEYKKSEHYLTRLVDSSIEFGFQTKRFSMLHFKGLANLSLLSIRQRKWSEARSYLERLRDENSSNDQHIRYQIYLLKLMLYTQQGKYSDGMQLIELEESWTKEFEKSIHFQFLSQEKVYVFFGKISCYFGCGDYKRAAQVMRGMLQQGPNEFKSDAWRIARIVNLILHFSLGNDVLLESELRSVHRMLINQKTMYRFEKLFLKFIVNIQKAVSHAHRAKAFSILHKQLLELQEVPFERNAFLYFDFITWSSKVSRINYSVEQKMEPISASEFVF